MADHKGLKTKEREMERLVKHAQAGDAESFGELYDILFDSLYRYVYYRVPSAECEDILEIVFLKTWKNLHLYKPGKSSFSSWIFRIAHNAMVDYYRNSKQHAELVPDLPDNRPEASSNHKAEQSLNGRILRSAIARLKNDHQQVVVLKFLNELNNDEIAMILGKSQNSLRILQFRALRALRKVLEEMGVADW